MLLKSCLRRWFAFFCAACKSIDSSSPQKQSNECQQPPFTCLSSVPRCKATNERRNYIRCQRTRTTHPWLVCMKSQIKAKWKPAVARLSSQAFLMEIRFGVLLRCLPTQSPSSTFIYTSYRSTPTPGRPAYVIYLHYFITSSLLA